MMKDPDYDRILTNEYLEWLVSFRDKWDDFADDRWDYHKEEIKIIDYNRVKLLPKLFAAVSEYCNENYIAAKEMDNECYYVLSIKGTPYRIGLVVGQGAYNYIEKEEDADAVTNVKMENIIKGIEVENFNERKEAYQNFETAAKLCLELDIPMGLLKQQIYNNKKNKSN